MDINLTIAPCPPTFDDPAKQAILSTLRALNDTWTKGNPSDLAGYFHPQMIAITTTDHHRREGAGRCVHRRLNGIR